VNVHYGDPQIAIGVVFAALALLPACTFGVIALQAGSEVSVERVHRVGYWLRKRWLTLLLVSTTSPWPHSDWSQASARLASASLPGA
jgi:hypothetical protein